MIVREGKPDKRITLPSRVIGHGKFSDSTFWVGTISEGVHLFKNDGTFQRKYLDGNSVTCVLSDSHGGAWFSTLADGVLVSFLEGRVAELVGNEFNVLVRSPIPGLGSGLYSALLDENVYIGGNHAKPKGQTYKEFIKHGLFLFAGQDSVSFAGG